MKTTLNLTIYFTDLKVITGLNERLQFVLNNATQLKVKVENISATRIVLSYEVEKGAQNAYQYLHQQ